ncbi:YGGT family protein [Rhynchospora pubera]|uniref:YGGT family protein n=1 Tax=Rhynchospora pubera TaxID=906938 RepID=A0AAV8HXK0_9POAL|nr:YGGT family protein [Rhynchospora pubera]
MAPLVHEHSPPQLETPQNSFPFSFLLSSSFPIPNSAASRPFIPDRTVQNAHQFLTNVASAFSNHPFIKPLLSFHSQFRTFCQMHYRKLNGPINVSLSSVGFAAMLPGDSVASLVVANGVTNFLNIYNALLFARLILTWFPNAPPAIVSPLSTLCDPYLNIFRGIIPPFGAIDFSPVLAFIALDFITNTAAALPAELPAATREVTPTDSMHLNLTTTQKMWMRRLCLKKSQKTETSN